MVPSKGGFSREGCAYMKILKVLLIVSGLVCGKIAFADQTITIGASPVPHAEILKQAVPILKKQGIDLKITEINDYVTPNLLVEQKQLDANFFQHLPYLAQFNKEHGINLVELVAVEIEPMGIYASSKYKNFIAKKHNELLPKGLVVGVPNDTTNEGRALLLLEANGFIKIRHNVKYPTVRDITSNPYNISVKELEPAMLPRALKYFLKMQKVRM